MTADLLALLDQLDEARAKATPGEWVVDEEWIWAGVEAEGAFGELVTRAADVEDADVELIVAAVNALPELLRLARERHALEVAVFSLAERFDDEARDALRDSEMFYDQEKWAAAKRCGSEARQAASHATDLRDTVTTITAALTPEPVQP